MKRGKKQEHLPVTELDRIEKDFLRFGQFAGDRTDGKEEEDDEAMLKAMGLGFVGRRQERTGEERVEGRAISTREERERTAVEILRHSTPAYFIYAGKMK